MNLERTTGVILRVRPLTDTSLIVQWLTPGLGRLATVAKGARGAKSPFRGQLDLFYQAEFSFARSRRSELHALRETRLLEPHAGLRRDLAYIQRASYAAALLEQATETESPLPALYEQFTGLLAELPRHPPQPQTVLAFEMKLLADLGLHPDLAEARLTPGSHQILAQCVKLDWPAIFRLRLTPAQVHEASQFLQRFIVFHLGKIPRSRAAAVATGV
ncbi:MAG TPA: DNA repair protein RecO [Verrucomicrobiae bacterium]|jgi:DNA repair protein RecO (recombination protein O)|nr:DNA repair protein RecO [Verrucomicrobiae bacterium]